MANPKYLSDLEVEKIEAFCADKVTFEAVRKVLLAGVYYNSVALKGVPFEEKNPAFNTISTIYEKGEVISDADLGATLRAQFEGIHSAQSAFNSLQNIKKDKEKPAEGANPAI
jgi:hypothetical protein